MERKTETVRYTREYVVREYYNIEITPEMLDEFTGGDEEISSFDDLCIDDQYEMVYREVNNGAEPFETDYDGDYFEDSVELLVP